MKKNLNSLFNIQYSKNGFICTPKDVGVSLYGKRGFTLVELVVTVSIVSIIMAVILFGYSAFNDGLTTSSANQEISLAIRQAQTYGLSVKESSTGDFSKGYGVSFSNVVADQTSYYIFVDRNSNWKNDNATGACTGECIEKVTLRNGVKITGICGAQLVTGTSVCPAGTGVVSMHVIFVRPIPDANIRFYTSAGAQVPALPASGLYDRGSVVLTSVKGKKGTTTIEKTGQIYVQ